MFISSFCYKIILVLSSSRPDQALFIYWGFLVWDLECYWWFVAWCNPSVFTFMRRVLIVTLTATLWSPWACSWLGWKVLWFILIASVLETSASKRLYICACVYKDTVTSRTSRLMLRYCPSESLLWGKQMTIRPFLPLKKLILIKTNKQKKLNH